MRTKGFVRFQRKPGLSVRYFQVQGDRRRAAAGCLVKIPHEAAECVPESVAQDQTDCVSAFFQQSGEIIAVIVTHVIRVADIGSKRTFGNIPAVDIQFIKPKSTDSDFRLFRFHLQHKGFPDIRRRNMPVKIAHLPGSRDKPPGEHHLFHPPQVFPALRFAIRRAASSSSVPIRLTAAQERNTPSQPNVSLRYPAKNPENALPT